jgi:ferredoxin--NADP+ reductase
MKAKKQAPEKIPAVVMVNKCRIPDQAGDGEVRELVIEIDQPGFTCEAGQSIGVYAPAPDGAADDTHLRWYSIADGPALDQRGRPNVTLCVRRIVQKDRDSGRAIRGRASNYLCDLQPGDRLQVAGPYGVPFPIPANPDAALILIGAGTGIAPFRSFIKTIYRQRPRRTGVVRLFYGTQNGLDVLYANDPDEDLRQYFDQETFEAFQALSPAPHWADPIAWDHAFSERGSELVELMEQPDSCFYVAGLQSISAHLDRFFGELLGAPERWTQQKRELVDAGRWIELLYGD